MGERKFVRFRIVDGPKWDSFHSYDDELVKFLVMKEIYSDEMRFYQILTEPVEITIRVDHIAAPIHADCKPIRGKILGDVPCGDLWPGFEKDIGLAFLHDGMRVLVKYFVTSGKGYITFEGAHASREWQLTRTTTSGTYGLESMPEKYDVHGICCEIS